MNIGRVPFRVPVLDPLWDNCLNFIDHFCFATQKPQALIVFHLQAARPTACTHSSSDTCDRKKIREKMNTTPCRLHKDVKYCELLSFSHYFLHRRRCSIAWAWRAKHTQHSTAQHSQHASLCRLSCPSITRNAVIAGQALVTECSALFEKAI